ncbi:hypothetical protein FCG67_19865 [Rhodococcus oryzae]|uniref:WXG100 family type VII secretion target n=1 Tax=Rhodococcus oryzae TaxID=2571143 RepID=A0ABY2RFY9_9NOCA|nr:hypothetical protein [Rhodococcus oryzae]TJZ75842.1 hypothetical protein FCG67_19865 [Rhodococcus oryzae]
MPIYVAVDADPQSCAACVDALHAIANGTDEEARTFLDARSSSESNWRGDGGEAFRDRITALERVTADLADRARDTARALQKFIDGITTAKERMVQAAAIALEAGLYAGPNPCDPVWIGDPKRMVTVGPVSPADEAAFAKQQAAYTEALAMAGEGRELEMQAHVQLREAMLEKRSAFTAFKGEFLDEAPWLAAGITTGYVQAMVAKQAPWDDFARTMTAQSERFRTIAAEPLPESLRRSAMSAAERFGMGADDAVRAAAGTPYNRLLPGGVDKPYWQAIAKPIVAEGGTTTLSKLGSKIPIVGGLVTVVQTGLEVAEADDKGDAALAVGKNLAGFAAGSVATELILASVAGGPATVAVVVGGVFIGWGVSEAIEWAGGE